ncbi:MAG: hypothetical protein FD177_644 [Desulfovibrionaceae bacterium]|nr:MAG: hypothetical protein FD177_644 [Desulfovibrionaceae bacterium]
MVFNQSEGGGRFGPPQDKWQSLTDFAPTLLGTLFGLRPQGQSAQSYGPSRLMAGPEGVKQLLPPRPGEPGYDPDPGMRLDLGPSTAVPMPNPLRMPEYRPGDVEEDGTQSKEPEGRWYQGMSGMGDALWREPAPGTKREFGPRPLPAYDSPGYEPIARIQPYRADNEYQQSPQTEPGPAKASRFRDPRTGKFDYWGWLDAGMANLGKGGTLFEDDTPDVNTREGVLDKPAAMTAAGAPENSRMPEESRFEARGADQGYDLGRPVAYAAQDGGGASPGGNAGQGQATTPAQPQGPTQQAQGTPAQPSQQPQQPFGENTIRREKQRQIDGRIVRKSESGPMNEPYDPESVAVRGRGGESLSPELKERIRARLKGTDYENMDLDSLKLYRGRTPWYMPSDKEGITLENHIYMKDGKFAPEMDDYHFNILVEEAVHAGQFQDKMTRPGYLWESLKNGYWNNEWEKKAREIAYPDEAQGQPPRQSPVVPRKPIEERNINE